MKLESVILLPHPPKNGDGVLEWIRAQRRTLENVLKKIKDDLDPAVGGDVYLLRDGSKELTADWDAGAFDIVCKNMTLSGGLNVGSASGAGVGDIHTSGKVGIGTSSPDSIFHIKANTPGTVGSHPAGQLIIQNPNDSVFGNVVITGYESDGDGNPDQQLWYLGSSSGGNTDIIFLNRRNANLHLGTNGVSRLTVLGNGNVGIGTTNPNEKLTVAGNADISGGLNVGSATGAGAGDIKGSGALTINDLHSIDQMDFDAALEDKISLYDDRLGLTTMYGFGVASGVLYYKSSTSHKFYTSANYTAAGYDLSISSGSIYAKASGRFTGDFTVDGGLNLGTAAGAGAGDAKLSSNLTVDGGIGIGTTPLPDVWSLIVIPATPAKGAANFWRNQSEAEVPVVSIIQDHLTGEQPCVKLTQDDISEGFIDFVGSDRGVIAGAMASAKSVRVEKDGVKYRVALYEDA